MMLHEYADRIRGTVLTKETTINPTNPNECEYPFPDMQNVKLCERYHDRANAIQDLLICGRLGEYRYYDMDQAIRRAMTLTGQLLK